MKNEILNHLDNPAQLEKLYRAEKFKFKLAFTELYPEIKDRSIAMFWNERLNFTKEQTLWSNTKDLTFVLIASLVAGLIAKFPQMLQLNEEVFYSRNIAFIVFPFLTAYFAWKNNLSVNKILVIAIAVLAGAIFINSLPNNNNSDTLVLSSIHMPLFLWSILGFGYAGTIYNALEKRLNFLKYNGDLIIMSTLLVISGGIMTGITIGLFSLIGISIEKFWFENVVIFGLPAVPILATYLTQNNPNLVSRISPVIARLFSPLVLVMLTIYLIAIIYTGKDPYNDREFLMIFNLLLIGVLAIIYFSIAEPSNANKSKGELLILILLSIITIIINGIALSAILFRISEWGITPNRAAVLGANVLILINLVFVMIQLFNVMGNKRNITEVRNAIAVYLPVYFIWTVIVTFVFPFLFSFN